MLARVSPGHWLLQPVLGGESELRKTISNGQSLGYQVAAHNNHYDAYRISEDWNESYIRKLVDGKLYKGSQYGGGLSYNICLSQAYELFARRDLPKIKELGFKGLHYIDVLSMQGPRPCYDPNHPETFRQDAEASNRILSLAREIFGGVQSEGSLDFAAPALDRCLFVHNGESSLLNLPYVDEVIPLYPLVYHGVLLYNMSNQSLNSLPGENEYLKNIEYGGLPLVYFYGHFTEKSRLGYRDYRYDTREGLKDAVAGIKRVYEDLLKLKHLQTEFIEGHKKLAEGVFQTNYSNGESVAVNFNDQPFKIAEGIVVPARGFRLL